MFDAFQRHQRARVPVGDEFVRAPKRGAENVPETEETGQIDETRFTATSVLVRESERARGAELEALARDLVHVCFVGPELRANAKLGILGRHREWVRDDCAHDVDDGRGDVRFERIRDLAVSLWFNWLNF